MVPFRFFPLWINLNNPNKTVSIEAIPRVQLMTNNLETLHRFVIERVNVIKKNERIEDQKIRRHANQNDRWIISVNFL